MMKHSIKEMLTMSSHEHGVFIGYRLDGPVYLINQKTTPMPRSEVSKLPLIWERRSSP